MPNKITPRFDQAKLGKAAFWLLLSLGVFLRLWRFGSLPDGFGQDEAYAAVDAWSLLTTGADSWGYVNPVYLVSWGSGMNALETYLMIPFMALLGMNSWSVRLPQLIVYCISLPVFYDLLKRMFSRKTALIGLAILAVAPWHIQAARWGLESNLAPCFLLFGMACFYRGAAENPRWFLLSGLMYGLTLYSYAMTWIMVPILLVLTFVWLRRTAGLKITGWLVGGAAVLGMLAVPLILFILVNMGLLPEIRTRFLSVPLMPVWRGSEVNFSLIWAHFKTTIKLLLVQKEEFQFSAEYGVLYHVSTPFVLLGGAVCAVHGIRALGKKEKCAEGLVVLHFLTPLAVGLLVDVCLIRINAVFFPWTMLAVIGISWLLKHLKGQGRRVTAGVIAAAYLFCFGGFLRYYFGGTYEERGKDTFRPGLREALTYAESVTEEDEDIFVMAYYPQVLLALQLPARETMEQMEWVSFENMLPSRSGRWRFIAVNTEAIDPFPAVMVVPKTLADTIKTEGTVTVFKDMAVVDMRKTEKQ